MNPKVDSYSGFFDNRYISDPDDEDDLGDRNRETGMNSYLYDRDEELTLYIMGLATDYCVKYTAIDAAKLGYNTNVILDGCRAVNINPKDYNEAVEKIKSFKIKMVNSQDLIK